MNLNARLIGVSALFNACQDEAEVVGCIRQKNEPTVIKLV